MNDQKFKPIPVKYDRVYYGADYNPDQWPEEIWPEDMRLMQAAGVNLVSLGIFSWAKIEPRPEHYEWAWLDRIMNLLAENGIGVNLATATASPPPWMAKLDIDTLPVNQAGARLWPGARQQFCPSSPTFRLLAQRLVRQIATRYRHHPALKMWHVGNEYGCHISECYSDTSARAFREWLKKRYDCSLDAMNQAWGTSFWSQAYSDWDEINPPRLAPTFCNPTQQLDWKRFSSDALLECFEMEARILREITPDVPITTNFMGLFKPLDYWKWAAQEDIISNDAYPDPSDPASPMDAAMACDMMRSLGNCKPWILMEQTPSQVNWRNVNALKRPGQMRLWNYQALGRGANGLMYFQWRASKAGAEKYHGGMVPHIGTENSRVWNEVAGLGQELKRIEPALLNSTVRPKIGILFDWESWWALELDSKPSSEVTMLSQLKAYYAPLYQNNLAIEFVPPWADLSQFKVVLVPNLYLIRDEDDLSPRLEKFVSEGGRLVMSFFSGITDQNEHIRLGGYPAPFRKLLGLRVAEFQPYVDGQHNNLRLLEAGQDLAAEKAETAYSCNLWNDLIDLEGAEVLASYTQDFMEGQAALTRHQFGQGFSYYLGTQPEAGLMERLLLQVCHEAGVSAPLQANVPAGVELVRRENEQGSFLFILNHNPAMVQVDLSGLNEYQLLLGDAGELPQDSLKLDGFGLAILSL